MGFAAHDAQLSTNATFGAVTAVVLGSLGTIAVTPIWMRLFPSLRQVERLE